MDPLQLRARCRQFALDVSRRARSTREFVARLAVIVEEADDSELWLDICEVRRLGPPDRVSALRREAEELTSIFAKARATTLANIERDRG